MCNVCRLSQLPFRETISAHFIASLPTRIVWQSLSISPYNPRGKPLGQWIAPPSSYYSTTWTSDIQAVDDYFLVFAYPALLQSTSHAMRWTSASGASAYLAKLQPTSPYGDECERYIGHFVQLLFQHIPHLRGQPEKAQLFIWYMAILIHIPLRGWTNNDMTQPLISIILTHTPVWGWTQIRLKARPKCNYFNPHPRMGMNFNSLFSFCIMSNFNPHPRMGMNVIPPTERKP